MLGDNALKVSIDHGLVQRLPFSNNSICECNPALGSFARRASAAGEARRASAGLAPRVGAGSGRRDRPLYSSSARDDAVSSLVRAAAHENMCGGPNEGGAPRQNVTFPF